jgi:hypothetical protein
VLVVLPKPNILPEVRKIVPDSFTSSRENKEETWQKCKYGMNDKIGLLINQEESSTSTGTDFAQNREEALKMQQEMEGLLV